MTQEQEQYIDRFDLLKKRHASALQASKKLSPQVDYARESALSMVGEVFDDIWNRAVKNPSDEIEAVLPVPGSGKLLLIKNLQASELQNFDFEKFPVNLVVGDSVKSLFDPQEVLEIAIGHSVICLSSEEGTFILEFKTKTSFFSQSKSSKIERTINPLLVKRFAEESDALDKALAINELTQAIYQIADNKLKAAVTT